MKTTKFVYHVDAFTTDAFRGNPAGVYISPEEPTPEWMQNIAMELNLSETAFLFMKGNTLNIRFFTPEAEIDLCGHATLSAAHILYETSVYEKTANIPLLSKAGELKVSFDNGWITMNFPAYPFESEVLPSDFETIVGIKPLEYYKSAYDWKLALLSSETELRNLAPDFGRMKKSEFGDLIVTSPSDDPGFDFCVRCFAPALGINEDPVTGSAHCALGPFWSRRLNKSEFVSHQVSKREGILKVKLKNERVEISGQAITIMRSELLI